MNTNSVLLNDTQKSTDSNKLAGALAMHAQRAACWCQPISFACAWTKVPKKCWIVGCSWRHRISSTLQQRNWINSKVAQILSWYEFCQDKGVNSMDKLIQVGSANYWTSIFLLQAQDQIFQERTCRVSFGKLMSTPWSGQKNQIAPAIVHCWTNLFDVGTRQCMLWISR